MRQILTGWGLDKELLEGVVDAVTRDPDRWIRLMMQLEHGFSPSRTSPGRERRSQRFCTFVTIGFVPLVPFVVDALPRSPSHRRSVGAPR